MNLKKPSIAKSAHTMTKPKIFIKLKSPKFS